jgi:hypothetical protein
MLIGSLAAVLQVAGVPIVAADKKIQVKDLPPVVQAAVQESTRGATINGYAGEAEGGKTMFEAETTVNGHSRDLLFDASGTLVEVEEATSLDTVPAAVLTALEARGHVVTVDQSREEGRHVRGDGQTKWEEVGVRGERRRQARQVLSTLVRAVVLLCAPLDLNSSGVHAAARRLDLRI